MDRSARQLANHLLLPGFSGATPGRWLLEAIDDGLAGAVCFSHNVAEPARVPELSARLHDARGGVLLAIDEEGGTVTRLHAAEGSPYPGHAALGAVDDVRLTERVGQVIGTELRAYGIDIDLAPVVDVNTDSGNPVIGVRAFGAEPQLVGRHGAAFVRGLQAAGVAAAAKHFPGHGATTVDSHVGLPRIDADLARLGSRELVPFRAAMRAGVRAVLTAHVVFPALDDRPATLSPAVMGVLREQLGFDGVVITDALDMQAISRGVGLGPGAVQAVLAGADLLCLGNPGGFGDTGDLAQYLPARDALVAAIADGTIGTARLEAAAARRAALVTWLEQARRAPVRNGNDPSMEVARRAVRATPGAYGSVRAAAHVVDLRLRRSVAAGRQPALVAQALQQVLPGTTAQRAIADAPRREGAADVLDSCAGATDLVPEALRSAAGRPLVVVTACSGSPSLEASQLRDLRSARLDAVVVFTGWAAATSGPDGVRPRVDLGERYVITYGDSRPTAAAAVELLTGAAQPENGGQPAKSSTGRP